MRPRTGYRLPAGTLRQPGGLRRRSLLLVASPAIVAVLLLGVLDLVEEGLGDLLPLGVAMEAAWLAAVVGLTVGCLGGARSWLRPGAMAGLLRVAWIGALVFPILYALLPGDLLYRVHADATAVASGEPDRLESLMALVFELIRAGGPILLLLPAVISVIPGAVNGCLRIKALLPASQLPGWLLVCAAPMFLLLWLVLLVRVNQPLQSLPLVAGVLLWAGSPIVFTLCGRVFVRPHIDDGEVRRIVGVKRAATALALVGIALIVTGLATAQAAGLPLLGLDADAAMTTHLDALGEADETVTLEEVGTALDEAKSFAYALDLSSWQLLIDVLAKLLLVTAVFADFVLRATLTAWRNDQALRERSGVAAHDAGLAALGSTLTR